MIKKKFKKRSLIPVILLLLLLLLTFWQYQLNSIKQDSHKSQGGASEPHIKLSAADSLKRISDSLALLRYNDSLTRYNDSLLLEKRRLDSLAMLRKNDSLLRAQKDLLQRQSSSKQLNSSPITEGARDTLRPELRVTPTSGRYYSAITVVATCSKTPCTLFYSQDNANFAPYHAPKQFSSTTQLTFFALDTAGNYSDTISRRYEFETATAQCPPDMSVIPMGDKNIYMDIYEWPNTLNEFPKVFVSHSEASALCASKGRRLCTKEEWQSACKGKYNSTYPYGDEYDQRSCVSTDSKPERSGRKKECRSFYGIHDMAGNVWEWTATPHETRSEYYYVSGGNWSSKDATKCTESKFSFFPQNQYQFVGFRCCL